MADLVKNRGLSGSQSKKKWRKNIDVTGLIEELGNKHTQELREKQDLNNPQLLIVEDTQLSRRAPLDPNRFKKKPVDPKVLSKHEGKRVAELARKSPAHAKSSMQEEEMFDAWQQPKSVEQPLYSKKHDEKAVKVPAVLTPIGGQSYNPHEQNFKEMVEEIIDTEVKKPKEFKPRRVKRIKRTVPRARNKIMRLEQLKAVHNRHLKQHQHQLMHLKRIAKQADLQLKKGEQTHRERLQKEESLRKEMETGRIKVGPKLAKLRYTYKQDIVPDLEPVPLSKQPLRDAVIRQRYDSIFRRGILEPKRHTVMINRTRNIKVKRKLE